MSEWKRMVRRIKIVAYVMVSIPYSVWSIVLFFTQTPDDQASTVFGIWIFLTILWLVAIAIIKMVTWIFGGNTPALKKDEDVESLKRQIQELRNVIKKLEKNTHISNPKDFRNEAVKYPGWMHKGITS